jgi:hypothetical protein
MSYSHNAVGDPHVIICGSGSNLDNLLMKSGSLKQGDIAERKKKNFNPV